MERAEFVAVDWGTTHLRLRLLHDARGEKIVLGERATAEGIGAISAGGHRKIFLANLEKLLKPLGRWKSWQSEGGEVYFSGMVTSSLGWFPTPYVPVPAGALDLLAGRRIEELGGLRLHFLPGVRTSLDVMRGEEVEAIGILDRRGGSARKARVLLVLPGTHSKWISWEGGRIVDFVTVPTGDLHAGLHSATLLSRTLPPRPVKVKEHLLGAFERGLKLAARDGPLASLFKARSLALLEGETPEATSALVSGVLIAGEILERTPAGRSTPVLLAGAEPLRGLYLRAFKALRVPAREVQGELAARASAEGLRRLRTLSRC